MRNLIDAIASFDSPEYQAATAACSVEHLISKDDWNSEKILESNIFLTSNIYHGRSGRNQTQTRKKTPQCGMIYVDQSNSF